MSAVEFVETLDGPPEDVWPFVSDPELLREWLDDDVEVTLRVGAPIRTRGRDGARVGVVDTVEVGRRLAFTWAPVAPDGGPATTVEFDIEADDDGEHTVLRIRERIVDAHFDVASITNRGGFRALARA